MTKIPLYKDGKITIDHHPRAGIDDHELILKKDRENSHYVLPRGILDELARTPRGGIGRKIANFNEMILHDLKLENISVDGLHVAICQAYIKKERRYQNYRDSKN